MPKGKQTSMYMSRFLMILLFIGTMFHNAFAQKKEMAQVRTYLKNGKELEKAEGMMRQLLTDSAMQKNEKAWLLLYALSNDNMILEMKNSILSSLMILQPYLILLEKSFWF